MTYIEELMTILAEECAEVIVECSKIRRFGLDAENLERLSKEIGDLQCMVNMCHEADLISFTEIDAYMDAKREKLKTFSENFK